MWNADLDRTLAITRLVLAAFFHHRWRESFPFTDYTFSGLLWCYCNTESGIVLRSRIDPWTFAKTSRRDAIKLHPLPRNSEGCQPGKPSGDDPMEDHASLDVVWGIAAERRCAAVEFLHPYRWSSREILRDVIKQHEITEDTRNEPLHVEASNGVYTVTLKNMPSEARVLSSYFFWLDKSWKCS